LESSRRRFLGLGGEIGIVIRHCRNTTYEELSDSVYKNAHINF